MKKKTALKGFLYVLKHPSDPNLLKIGMTRRDPLARLKEHNRDHDKVTGEIVKTTGEPWELINTVKVDDVYLAEHAFWKRYPLDDVPFVYSNELLSLSMVGYKWVEEGLELARKAGARADPSIPPIPKPTPKRGSKWIEAHLEETGIKPLKSCGNGITKAWFACKTGHKFKIGGYKLLRIPSCPVCNPEQFSAWELNRHIEFEDN